MNIYSLIEKEIENHKNEGIKFYLRKALLRNNLTLTLDEEEYGHFNINFLEDNIIIERFHCEDLPIIMEHFRNNGIAEKTVNNYKEQLDIYLNRAKKILLGE